MGELPLPAVIRWLVHERFGGYDAETKVHGYMQYIPPDQAVEAKTYRDLLKRLPEEQIRQTFQERLRELVPLAEEAIEDRESVLFFNQPNAVADYEYWARFPFWSLRDAVALTLGRDPGVVHWQAFEREAATATLFAARYRRLGDLVHASIQARKLSQPIEPAPYLQWCHRMGLVLPEGLIAAVEDQHGRAFDWMNAALRISELHEQALNDNQAWADAYENELADHAATRQHLSALDLFVSQVLEQQNAERAEHAAEIEALRREQAAAAPKELKTRERESLLKLFIAAVMDSHGYDPLATRSPIPGELVAATERLGIPLSDETVRKFLKMAAELLPPEAKITAA
ncbi:MAG TPA: hypothetical protein PLH23_10360 [Hyphomonadaceae bacterium]|nr:hypothetical protein [Hyphomonadaceae bacterium]HPI48660.1 hypothetical protein [Hyphomonadaceae bacterium]